MQREENQVEMKMNEAAEMAAKYKDATQTHDAAFDNVNAAHAKVVAQKKRVDEAKLTLKAEEKSLRQAKIYTAKMVQGEQHDRFLEESAGHVYTDARAAAIAADNALQNIKYQNKMKNRMQKAAIRAVQREAKDMQEEIAKKQAAQEKENAKSELQKHKANFKPEQKSIAKPAANPVLKDCTELPKVYSEAGGSCSDCPKWADKGECTAKEYSKFMAHYCAKSCAAKH